MSRSLARTTALLDALAERPLASLGELAERCHLPPATCARLLAALVRLDWADQVAPRGPYRLGLRPQLLAERRPYLEELVRSVRPVAARLAERLGQSVVVVRLRGDRRQVLLLRSPQGDNAEISGAQDQDLYGTATGRLLLAHLAPRLRHLLIAQLGLPQPRQWPGILLRDELDHELRRLRRQGWLECRTKQWHSCASWAGRWDGEDVCLGTFASPGRLHPSSMAELRSAVTALGIKPR